MVANKNSTQVNESGGRNGVGLRRNGVMTFCHQTSFPHTNYQQSLLLTEGWKGERGGLKHMWKDRIGLFIGTAKSFRLVWRDKIKASPSISTKQHWSTPKPPPKKTITITTTDVTTYVQWIKHRICKLNSYPSVNLSYSVMPGAFLAVGKNSHDFLKRYSISNRPVLLFKLVFCSVHFTITLKVIVICLSLLLFLYLVVMVVVGMIYSRPDIPYKSIRIVQVYVFLSTLCRIRNGWIFLDA